MQSEKCVPRRATARATCLRASTPVARGNTRTMGRRRVRGRCFRTVGTCSIAQHASGWLLCACVTASWMFCVLGLPLKRIRKAGNQEKTIGIAIFECVNKCTCNQSRFNVSLSSAYPMRSSPTCALYPAPQLLPASPCKPDRCPCRSVDGPAGLVRFPREQRG